MNIKKTATALTEGIDAVHYVTIGGTPTAGTFKLVTPNAGTTGSITWSATNATLLANIQAKLDLLYEASNTLVEDVSLSSGIGVFKVTFQNLQGKQVVAAMTYINSLTGSSPTLAIAVHTAGVEASYRDAQKGQMVLYYTPTPPAMYWNTSDNPCNPTWSDFQTP